jgi:glutamate-1-semialdehyde 2,1-aminomutase
VHARPYSLEIVEHTLPPAVTAGETYGVRLTLVNTGSMTWAAAPPDGHCVHLFVLFGEALYQKVPLPHGDVPPGGRVTFHFALRLAEAGRHLVRLELIHERRAWFSQHGCPGVAVDVEASAPLHDATGIALERSLARNLWHFQPTSGIRRFRDGRTVPLFVSRAKGCRVWDPEGHEYLDYTMGWGSTILGYADDRIQAAIAGCLATSPLAPLPDPLEMEVSEMIAADFPSAEMVAFGKNGSDVCTLAARLARLATGRRQILSCGFHGWQDFAVEPHGELHTFAFNDPRSFRALYERHRRDLAAVMIEPAGPFAGPDHGPGGDADPAFLGMLAQAARDAGALLIFDEIITGYRYPGHSVQRATGVTADLTCLGKALASGMPLAAVAGRGAIFHTGFAHTHYCPTFKAEIYSLAAARAAIDIYRRERVAEHIWKAGDALKARLDASCRALGLRASCRGPAFRFSLVFTDPDPARRRRLRTLYMQELLREGVLTVNGVMLPSYAHGAGDLDATAARAHAALARIAPYETDAALDRAIEIPLL